MSNQIKSGTWTAVPNRSRCRYWCKVIPAGAKLPLPSDVDGASDIPTAYLRTGDEVEVFEGDFVLEGEANHPTKQRGWSYWVRELVGEDEFASRPYKAPEVKAFLREKGEKDLLRGAGDCAAMIRYLHALRLGYRAWRLAQKDAD